VNHIRINGCPNLQGDTRTFVAVADDPTSPIVEDTLCARCRLIFQRRFVRKREPAAPAGAV
jgi:hypothetical protein